MYQPPLSVNDIAAQLPATASLVAQSRGLVAAKLSLPTDDLGVHLTLNAEHECYRWGPITHAPSLQRFLHWVRQSASDVKRDLDQPTRDEVLALRRFGERVDGRYAVGHCRDSGALAVAFEAERFDELSGAEPAFDELVTDLETARDELRQKVIASFCEFKFTPAVFLELGNLLRDLLDQLDRVRVQLAGLFVDEKRNRYAPGPLA